MTFATLPPVILMHIVFAIGALLLGPFALFARKGSRLHRLAGYLWLSLMFLAALSSLFIHDFRLPNIAGYTPIHILTLVVFIGIGRGLWHVVHRNIPAHRRAMLRTYVGGCVVAGLFALVPGRFLGQMLWHQALGLI